MMTDEDVPEESTWAVRDPEAGEVEELAAQQEDTVPEHEPGDDDWSLEAEESG